MTHDMDDNTPRRNRLEERVAILERQLADARAELARVGGSLAILEGAYNRAADVAASQAIADAEARRSTSSHPVAPGPDRRSIRWLAKGVTAVLLALAAAITSGKC